MKKVLLYTIATFFVSAIAINSRAQSSTALDFSGQDCNGVNRHLFADLDSGKAVILFFFMPSCGACPPPAKAVQTMANRLIKKYPGMIKAYVYPYNNATTCTTVKSWMTSSGVSLYIPMDSGATQVANYGGFGMPTVALVGGKNHRRIFSTAAFSYSDTGIMRDSIINFVTGGSAGVKNMAVNNVSLYPNPAANTINVSAHIEQNANVTIDILDMTGKQIMMISSSTEKAGEISKSFNIANIPNGSYMVRICANGNTVVQHLNILH